MQIEDYFEFLSDDDIRIKGHRIGIESVLYEYIHRARSVEEIAERFDTLSLEQIHATILYYLQNKKEVTKYLAAWLDYCRRSRNEDQKKNAQFYERMRKLKESREVPAG